MLRVLALGPNASQCGRWLGLEVSLGSLMLASGQFDEIEDQGEHEADDEVHNERIERRIPRGGDGLPGLGVVRRRP